MIWLEPLAAPVALAALAHAWIIPELYAFRGASVVRPKGPRDERSTARESRWRRACSATCSATSERELQRDTGLALERGELGVWLRRRGRRAARVARRRPGALLLRAATGTASCRRPTAIAHLLLALRVDEEGFATVANHAFAGAPWRVRRRLPRAHAPRPGRGAAQRLR